VPHGPYNHHFRKTAGFFLNLDISLSVVAILVQLATAIINSHLGSLEKFLMSRCQSGLCRIATLIFAYAPLVLFGLIPMMTGCDNVQNQEQLATTPAQSAAHDDHDHDHDDHDHDDHDDHDHDDHDDHDHDDHDDHDHDDHDHELPATVEAAIAQLKKVTNQVREALKGGETGKADSLVHSIGHLIEDLNEKIASADVEQKVKDAATAASEKIFEAYGEIDNVLHGAEEEIKNIKFSDFGPTINKATATLEGLLLEAKEAVTGSKKPATEEPKKEEKKEAKPKAAKKTEDTKPAAEEKPASEKASADAAADKPAVEAEKQGSE